MIARDGKVELLGRVELFRGCTQRELREIARLTDEVDVQAGYVLAREGRTGREFFVIAEGTAQVTIDGRDVAELGPGGFCGEMSLLDMGPRTATVTATTPMRMFVVDARAFASFLDTVPSAARRIMSGLSARLREADAALVG